MQRTTPRPLRVFFPRRLCGNYYSYPLDDTKWVLIQLKTPRAPRVLYLKPTKSAVFNRNFLTTQQLHDCNGRRSFATSVKLVRDPILS